MAKKDEKETSTSTSSGSKRLDADRATPAPDAEVPHGKVEPDVDTTKADEAKPAAKKSARPQPMIADLLADPAFDPDGKVRSKLAQHSMQHGARALAPTDLVDADGNVVEQ